MTDLTPDVIAMKLELLEQWQSALKEDYTKKFEDLGSKIDKLSEKLDNLPQNYVTRVEFDNAKEKIHAMEDKWNKIMWIIITAVIGAVLSLVLIHNP